MQDSLLISNHDAIHYIKISCQLPGVIEAIASEKIMTQTAQKLGIKVEEAQIQQEGDRFRAAKKLVKAQDTWIWLQNHHLSVDNFEELIYKKILSQKLATHLFEDKVESFFFQNKLDYLAAVTYEIILDDKDLALELFYALQEGETTFIDITREYISNPDIRRTGGYQGIRRRIDFRPEIASAVFAAKPPQAIKPITTNQGVSLIWVEEIIQPELDDKLRQQIIIELFNNWLKKEISKMQIKTQFDSVLDTHKEPVVLVNN
ncbi:MAG: peptidylprolyl isomerase [Cyanobacteria bacterium J06639_18]